MLIMSITMLICLAGKNATAKHLVTIVQNEMKNRFVVMLHTLQ